MPPSSLLPLRSAYPSTTEYLYAKYDNYLKCVENEMWDDAYINAHLILVHWLYQKIWVLLQSDSEKIRAIFSLHSFDSKYPVEKFLVAGHAIELSQLKLEERKLANVFRQIFLDDTDMKRLKNLVDKRNSILHPSGTILCSDADSLSSLIDEQYDLVTKISLGSTGTYIELASDEFRDLNSDDMLNWENDSEVEAYVVRRFELTQADIDAMLLKLDGAV